MWVRLLCAAVAILCGIRGALPYVQTEAVAALPSTSRRAALDAAAHAAGKQDVLRFKHSPAKADATGSTCDSTHRPYRKDRPFFGNVPCNAEFAPFPAARSLNKPLAHDKRREV